MWACVSVAKYAKTSRPKFVLSSILMGLPAFILHAGTLPILAAYIVRPLKIRKLSRIAGITLVVVVVVAVMHFSVSKITPQTTLQRLWAIHYSPPRGRADYRMAGSEQHLVPMLAYGVVWMSQFLAGPPIWKATNLMDLAGSIDGLIYVVLTVLAVVQTLCTPKGCRRPSLSLLIGLFVVMVVLAMGTSNYGTALRHRQKILPLLACLASRRIMP
jgi:hypothetical protein